MISASPPPAGDEISVGARDAVEELAEDHRCDSPIWGRRIPLARSPQYKSSVGAQKRRRRYACGGGVGRGFKPLARPEDPAALPIPTMNRRRAPWVACR